VGLEAAPAEGSQTPTVQVVIGFDKLPEKVLPGATAAVEISLGTKEGVLWLPRGPFLTSGGQLTVFRVEGAKARRMEAFFGIVTSDKVEVVKGLSEGDVVVTSSYQDFVQYPEVALTLGGGSR
jgi:HlyD family secretion protein